MTEAGRVSAPMENTLGVYPSWQIPYDNCENITDTLKPCSGFQHFKESNYEFNVSYVPWVDLCRFITTDFRKLAPIYLVGH